MDLTTRCPKCGTVFQANLSDLQLRKGYIRCVQCAHIFDGYAEVVSDPLEHDPGDGGRKPEAPGPYRHTVAIDADEPPPQVFRSGRHAAQSASLSTPQFTVGTSYWRDDRPEPHIVRTQPLQEDADLPRAQAEPFVVEPHPGRHSRGGSAAQLLEPPEPAGGWATLLHIAARLLLLLLVLLLVAQLLYVYRAQVAQAVPALRPWLEQACGPLRCQVPYARDIKQIAITGSALKIVEPALVGSSSDGAVQQHFVLHVTLRNQGSHAQEWPTLVLDLNDMAGTRLVRRNLAPAEYLGHTAAAGPFAAHSEVQVRVPLTLSGMQINGYQLDMFFP